MKYKDVINLGWKDRNPNNKNEQKKTFVSESGEFGYYVMSVVFGCGENDSFDLVIIKCVPENCNKNIWENSETHFYGELKTKEDLYIIMQLLGIVEYVR